MPEATHVEILRSGPRAWNAWREKNPSTIPDLSGIALKLSERQMGPINGGPINLKSTCLKDAFLRFATLLAADLEAADMSNADLVHARLDHANLSSANLRNVLLDHADFAGANLTQANLCGASLQHAKNLTQAQIEYSIGSDATILPNHLVAPWLWLKITSIVSATTSMLSKADVTFGSMAAQKAMSAFSTHSSQLRT
ncbi:MAG: pentapeptide repeat-containing protein [Methyloceanibacter sp.]